MRELIERLDVADNGAAGALRVIDHFDHLVEAGAATTPLVRAAAALAGCPAGFHDASRTLTRRFASNGQALPDDADHIWPRLSVPGRPGSSVWLERVGDAGPLDPLVLERYVRALQSSTTGMVGSTTATIRIACDADTSSADRRDAVAKLGLSWPITVVATALGVRLSSRSTPIGNHVITLFTGLPTFAAGVRAGTARADALPDLPLGVGRALVALRVTDRVDGPGASIVLHHHLSALASIAERFTPEQAAAVEDVRRIEALLPGHPWVVDIVQAVLDRSSLRQAASVLHVHHSTLQERLAWLANHIGYALTHPGGRQRAAVAVLLWRVAQAA
ncbi:hypothetical protein FB382_003258 [Nocardioides ginsengisegetis]|uniref:PucR C-terminal helix-turn-helix domain-containing protein n=1 Tax=Nocardioides ginsengisegetis TaxID=661491 RepID=A0A7W3J2E1_9ACTN|nr:helix-turn-helix domain-containing protein [Nocardioides ginsengisegetis]MBA8804967.1 hypothetical protein [Nocardioides ginsengisegetis]